jgi:hypothetical protein
MKKLNQTYRLADIFTLEQFVAVIRDQMILNHTILQRFLERKYMSNNIVLLSCILHQPLVPYTDLGDILSTIKSLV